MSVHPGGPAPVPWGAVDVLLSVLAPMARGAVDLVWPWVCPGCGRTGERPEAGAFLCARCQEHVRLSIGPACPICDHPVGRRGTFCEGCLGAWPRTRLVVSLGPYSGPLARLVRVFKYGGCIEAGEWLAGRLAERLLVRVGGIDAVVPVPATRGTERQRGFNPAAVVAAHLARELAVPLEEGALVKVRSTPRLAGLRAIDREVVLHGAHALGRAGAIEGRQVLLVDDVYTTGATFAALAGLLLDEGGASGVVGAVLARTVVETGLV